MKFGVVMVVVSTGVGTLVGCSGSDSTTDGLGAPSTGGGGQGGTGGTGGAAGAGGAAGTGGAAGAGGTAGGATGGAAGSAGVGGAGGAESFWTGDYAANGSPDPSNGEHNAGKDCMTCHTGGEEAWLFGGTVYQADGTTPAAHVQVGVRDGTQLYAAYSGSNGNFWVPKPGGASVDWAGAEVRLRNANGERQMSSAAAANCNSCHTGGMVLLAP